MKPTFILPPLRLRKAPKTTRMALMASISTISTERVMAASPKLQAVQAFLKASRERVP